MSIGGHHNPVSLKDEWLTPPYILKALGSFDLDPCAPIDRPWDMAKEHYTIEDNGLNQSWHGRVWCNPPYGTKAAAWLDRLAVHGEGTALLFARTETAMFFEHVWRKAWALLFIEGRLHFHHADGTRAKSNAGGPSVLIAYGDSDANRLDRVSGIPGKYVRLQGGGLGYNCNSRSLTHPHNYERALEGLIMSEITPAFTLTLTALQEANKEIERLSSKGELLRAMEKAARELYPWLGTTAADGVDPNLYLRLQYALDAVSEEQCQHEWYAPYCGRFSHLTLVCKLCGATE